MPFFFIEKAIWRIADKLTANFINEHEYHRGDETLLYYLAVSLRSWAENLHYFNKNRYGYEVYYKNVESGKQDGDMERVKMYRMNSKAKADRYNTATHEDYYYDKANKSGTGIIDYQSYAGSTMATSEMLAQNSYALNDKMSILNEKAI